MVRWLPALGLLCMGCADTLYSTMSWVAMPFVYRKAELPESRIVRDVPYRLGRDADPVKHRLDLFLPDAGLTGWPVLVFVHGGGWTSGDKGLRAGGRDVYGNIGRFFAGRGIGTAVVSYRLQPDVDWQQQVDDVARAVAWVHTHVGEYGADPGAIFVAGHSAGAQLAAHVVMDPGLHSHHVCGFIPVSGAGFDLADAETYALGASPAYYEQRFRNGDATDAWKRAASPVTFARPDLPPALILYADGDEETFQRQARVLHEALQAAGAEGRTLMIPGQDHYRIVVALSRPNSVASSAIEEFIRGTECGA